MWLLQEFGFPARKLRSVNIFSSSRFFDNLGLLVGLGGGAPQEKGKLHFARECRKSKNTCHIYKSILNEYKSNATIRNQYEAFMQMNWEAAKKPLPLPLQFTKVFPTFDSLAYPLVMQ